MGRIRLARRELTSLRREKTIVLALLVQLFIAAFSSFLVVGLVSMYDPGSVGAGRGVTFAVTGDAAAELSRSIDADDRWLAIRYPEQEQAMAAFSRGRVDAVLRADRQPAGNVSVTASVPDGSLQTTVIIVQVREALSAYERDQRNALSHRLTRRPVPPAGDADGSPYFAFTYTVLLPLLMILPAFISGSIAADAVIEEVERGTISLLRVTPLSDGAIVDGKLLAAVGVAPIQAAAWLVLLDLNGTQIADPISIVVLATAATMLVATYGAGLALALADRRSVQFLYSIGVVILFTGTYLLPETPANSIARLAVGHPSTLSYAMVIGAVIAAVFAYGGLRVAVDRTTF